MDECDGCILCLQDYERHEDERSGFLKNHLLKYVDLCVGVDETSAVVSDFKCSKILGLLLPLPFFLPPFPSLPSHMYSRCLVWLTVSTGSTKWQTGSILSS